MAMFTHENTIGFSDDELDVMNAALDELLADAKDEALPELEKHYHDRLSNLWYEGLTVDELVAAAR
jgi:hypothetical protein